MASESTLALPYLDRETRERLLELSTSSTFVDYFDVLNSSPFSSLAEVTRMRDAIVHMAVASGNIIDTSEHISACYLSSAFTITSGTRAAPGTKGQTL